MTSAINEFISSIVQIILFSLIPLIWWLITARKKESFFSWIGLKKPVGNLRRILIPAVCFAVINEKNCEGSIWPGWLLHGTFNLITGLSQL